mmetsp:Transcript_22736/g.38971  ORF Transcript_22736/g.38971 Transcript_22736/m.38971 type:complete len:309 (+) Transcript_22736:76-1002(+)|eukprot:CAMPEP_0196666082 /NCGR_PEP_ID=MMETSP1086-20130531/63775_1 /TAXON_ID=77921 /ORGANISM="Cyanoptyche  gloeocystis , Strain SAG4.97" /LENGTH=308 /DNA_ID=CAMNT_0042003147 /DNA_START=74 /DNA_END=1000 /DNA_ORIENTATION=-
MAIHSIPAAVFLKVLNIIILLLGGAMIGAGSYWAQYGTVTVATWVIIAIGIFVCVLALLGLFSSLWGKADVVFLYYAVVVFLSIAVLFVGIWVLSSYESAESTTAQRNLRIGGIFAIITFVVLVLCGISAAFVLGIRNVTKKSLILFNTLFTVLGVGIIVLGTISIVHASGFEVASGVVIGIGVFMAFVSLLGVLGAAKESAGVLIIYSILTLVTFVALLVAGSLAFIKRESVLTYIANNWDSTFSSIFSGYTYAQASAWVSSHLKAVGAILIVSAFGLLSGIVGALILRAEVRGRIAKQGPKHKRLV